MHRALTLVAVSWTLAGCRTPEEPTPGTGVDSALPAAEEPPAEEPPNVLIVLLDDVGVGKVSSYGMHPDPPATPHIDALAAEGQRFTQAWAYPVCSPTRAAVLTGHHPRRYGIGNRLLPNVNPWELVADEVTALPEVLSAVGYDTSFVGKWHLSSGRLGEDGLDHPRRHGFGWSEGSLANLVASYEETDQVRDYFYWEELRNGEVHWKTRYATTETIDDAIARARSMEEPWLLWVALPSVHTPLHIPPEELYDGPEPTTDIELVDAMVEAMDAEIGRLVAELGPDLLDRTNLVLMADNGTAEHGIAPPLDPSRGKGTVYEGGARVPLIVRGPAVAEPGAVSDALVHAVDIFPTAASWAGADVSSLDLDGQPWDAVLDDPTDPGSEQLFVEVFSPIGLGPYFFESMAARDAELKYIVDPFGREELRRVGPAAPSEGPDLLVDPAQLTPEEEEAWARLADFVQTERERLQPR